MSIVNKMLQDLDNRAQSPDHQEDYQPQASKQRTRNLMIFIGVFSVIIGGYFTLRYTGTAFIDEAIDYIAGNDQQQKPKNTAPKVSVNSELNKMMPAKPMAEKPKEKKITPADLAEMAPEEMMATMRQAAPVEKSTSKDLEQAPEIMPLVVESITEEIASSSESADIEQLEDEVEASSMSVDTKDVSEEDYVQLLKGQVQEAISDKDALTAINYLMEILKITPEAIDTRKKLAIMLFSNDRIAQATSVLETGLELQPQESSFRLMLARLYFKTEQPEYAYKLLGAESVSDEFDPEYYSFKASLAQQLGHHADASTNYQQLTSYEPQRAKWWLGLALSLDKLGEFENALAAYEQASELKQLPFNVDSFIQQRIAALGG